MHSRRLGLLLLAVAPVILAEAPASLPLFFVPNVGQMATGVRYAIQTPEMSAGFTTDGVFFKAGDRELHLNFQGASRETVPFGYDKLSGRANFLIGNDERQWKKDIPVYSRIQYENIYPGITANYAIDGHRIKSEYRVAPGAGPASNCFELCRR